ncbi:MAG: hypothetical protein D6714_07475 [Bacteroidetes bacterium]|nr:MAG: hypothetical protein D6714_07475 [Bacteroidota bacterium]
MPNFKAKIAKPGESISLRRASAFTQINNARPLSLKPLCLSSVYELTSTKRNFATIHTPLIYA